MISSQRKKPKKQTELEKEIERLQSELHEKDKVIEQLSTDLGIVQKAVDDIIFGGGI